MKRFLILATVFVLTPLLAVAAEGDTFQPLTGIPIFENVKAGGDLSSFFNQLYVLSVGAAAVIAVAQIMIAGFKWATAGGSHSAIEQSRDLIRNSVLGLLLVLSPTLVFGIINPSILSLKIDTKVLQHDLDTYVDPNKNPAESLLSRDDWGAFNDQCNLHANFTPFLGYTIPKTIELTELGKGNIERGRQCCNAASGKIGLGFGEEEIDVCDISWVAGDFFEGKSLYVAHIKGQATWVNRNSGGVLQNASGEVNFFTAGAGPDDVAGVFEGDADTLIMHGFHSAQECTGFINGLTPATLLQKFKAGVKSLPATGLLEAKYGLNDNVFPADIDSITSITYRRCDAVGFSLE